MTPSTELAVQRLRHPLKFRAIQVRRIRQLSPSLLRVTFTGDALEDFVSASFDDHIKVFFPARGQTMPVLPTMGEDGLVFPPDAPRPAARDYTPRRFDAAARELDIEFVLHGDGPGASWAAQAAPGQWLGIGGPRGSFVIPQQFDWHLLAGDEAALPAIGRRLEELPAQTRVLAVIEVANADHQVALDGPALSSGEGSVRWVHRDRGETLATAIAQLPLPAGEGFAWAAGEALAVRALRSALLEAGLDKRRMRVSSYWKRGAAGVHETIED